VKFAPTTTIIERCNLTILLEGGYRDLPEFLATHRVEIVASMPCYTADNVNAQRGDGVFDASIAALQRLNAIGYGIDPTLPLHLVYNPGWAFLPGPQDELEADYKRELRTYFGIEFNRLYTITNLPIARFASWLRHNGRLVEYMTLLASAFNPATVEGLMCRDTINVSWLGEVFDCDFNQMLDLHVENDGKAIYLWDLDPDTLEGRSIRTASHRFGCTAGAGSSCGGAIEHAATPVSR
jgi:radical SAM/Cys-rich protein